MRSISLFVSVCSLLLAMTEPTSPNYENLNAVVWMQTSVEYKASAAQTYHAAERALLRGLREKHWTAASEQTGDFEGLPPAVILDLDETVLDNSIYQARLVASGEHYSDESWTRWEAEQKASLIPGAMDFLQVAHAHGVAAIFVTNRSCDPSNERDATVQLLKALQIPTEPIAKRLICASAKDGSDKTARRTKIAAEYRILLLIGDQLGDFVEIPKSLATIEGREKIFRAHERLWGERWFQLPNPSYGSWEGAVGYSLKQKLAALQR